MPNLRLCLPYSIVLWSFGSCSNPTHSVRAQELENGALRQIKKTAAESYRSGKFHPAAVAFHAGYELAMSSGALGPALGCLNNAAGAELADNDYAAALQTFLNAKRLAQRTGDGTMEAVIWLNLSSLYFSLRNYTAAEQAALRASAIAATLRKFPYQAEILAQLASFRTRSGDYKSGLRLFQEAINSAADSGNEPLRAILNERAGWVLLERGSYDEAEPYVLEAFRLRQMFHERDLRSSYITASRLELLQGDIGLASALIDREATFPNSDAGPALWLGYYQRGLVRLAQRRNSEARAALSQALNAAEAWHEGAAFSDQSRMAADVGLHEVVQAFVEASVLCGQFGEAFIEVERDRAAGLRQATHAIRRSSIPTPEFASTLGRLREAQSAVLAKPTLEHRRAVERLRSELSEMEAAQYLTFATPGMNISERTVSPNALRNIQDRIRPEEALLSLYAGQKESYLWALTADHFEFHRLPGERVLADLASRVATSVEQQTREREALCEVLYRDLFGQISQTVSRKQRWIISGGEVAFKIPFPALLMERSGQAPQYLVERHSLQRIPSAWMLSRDGGTMAAGRFVGIGDGIYNPADPRWSGRRNQAVPLQLARLASSGREVEVCGRQWLSGLSPKILTGAQASRKELQMAIKPGAAVIHFATHFLYPENRPDEAAIDLGIDRQGRADLLTREDVANWNTPGTLVVMSGCGSAASGAAPGAGILGLSRAWLMAGASTVIGSLWPTADDSGSLFESFYRNLRIRTGPQTRNQPVERVAADALQIAQVEMLHSGAWRSQPRYWSAFYVLGKD